MVHHFSMPERMSEQERDELSSYRKASTFIFDLLFRVHLPMDKKSITENLFFLYNPCIQGKEKQIWKSYQGGFPKKSPFDVIRWGIPINKKMEILCCLFNLCDSKIKRKRD